MITGRSPAEATELAGVIRSRQVSVREVVEAHLRRIDAVNPELNAIVIRVDEQALAAADAADRMAGTGAGLGPLHGVPFTIKECFDLAGTPTTYGARLWSDAYPSQDAPISTGIPFKVGTDLTAGKVAKTIWQMRMAIAVNALGLPAVAVPVGVVGGLPQVVQIIGPRYREDLCLDAADALEEALGVLIPIDPR